MKTKEVLKRIKDYTVEFYCSDYFMALVSTVTVLFWALGYEIAGAAILVCLACLYMWLGSDLKPVITVIMLITMVFSLEQIHSPQFLSFLYAILPIIVVSFAFNLIYFRDGRVYRKGKLFYGMLAAYLVTLLSGITYIGYNKTWMLAVLGVGIGIYFVYFLCINCSEKNLGTHICKILFFAGIIVFLEMVIWFARQPDFIEALLSKQLRVGWGMSNTMAVLFVMAVPAVVWLGMNDKRYSRIMFPYALVMSGSLLLTLSRGNILFGLPIIVVSLIIGFVKAKDKKPTRIIAAVSVCTTAVILAVLPVTGAVLQRLNEAGLNPNGRVEVYTQALKNFFASPIFGVGYFKPEGFQFPIDGPAVAFLWKTHNTPLQILSCSGIVGVIGMAPYYFQRYQMLLKNIRFNGFNFMSLLVVLAYELEGMVDVTFLSVYQLFFVFGLLAASELESYNKQSLSPLSPYQGKIASGGSKR